MVDKETAIKAIKIAFWEEDLGKAISFIQNADKVIVKCKDCKYFELDHLSTINDIPVITMHEVCTKWSNGCKTDLNGFCFMGEKNESNN